MRFDAGSPPAPASLRPPRAAPPIILTVKGSGVGVAMVRDLRGVVERENAAVGVLISLQEPTQPMRAEAVDAGFFEARGIGQTRVSKVQILTIEQLLAGGRIQLPPQSVIRSTPQAPRARRMSPRERAAP